MTRVYLMCQHCRERLKVVETLAGRQVRCPSCLGVSLVPHRPERDSNQCDLQTSVGKATIDSPVEDGHPLEAESGLKLTLEIDPDGLFATLHIEHGVGGIPDRKTVVQVMESQSIRHGLDIEAIDAFYQALADGEVRVGYQACIARCTQSKPPLGDRIELTVEPDPPVVLEEDPAEDDDESRVDFKDSGRILTIVVGEVVAHLTLGKAGCEGMSVTGAVLPFSDEEVITDVLGEGVALDPDGRTIRSTKPGRAAIFENVLNVLQVYEVDSDVDFSTGNIRFDGHVIIRGSVLDEFEIECKSLEVEGPVGAATLFVESDAILSGGINGNGKCRLFIGGRCEVKYVNQVSAHIGGDLVVERGITNSEIVCWGTLSASRVVGGKSSARMGYLIEDLGSDLGVVTVVAPGMTTLPTFYGHHSGEREDSEAAAPKSLDIKVKLPSDAGSQDGDGQLPTAILVSVRQALLNRFLGQRAANDDVERALVERIDVVNITSKMFADVVVCSATRCTEFVEKSAGKMSIRLNEETGDFEKMPFRKLRVTRTCS